MTYNELDIAISLARYSELYDLVDYDNLAKRISIELEEVLVPLRRKLLRGFYLMNALNNCIDDKSFSKGSENNTNSYAVQCIQKLQKQFIDVVYKLKTDVENQYETFINIDTETDAQIFDRFKNNQTALDLVCIRSLNRNTYEEVKVPIDLSTKNMRDIGYNNKRVDKNIKLAKNTAKDLAEVVSVLDRHKQIARVIELATDIKKKVMLLDDREFLIKHTNAEVKEWLYVREFEDNTSM